MGDKKLLTPIVAIRTFFGMRPGDTLHDFAAEIKQLSEEEKIYLARGACAELGCELDLNPVK